MILSSADVFALSQSLNNLLEISGLNISALLIFIDLIAFCASGVAPAEILGHHVVDEVLLKCCCPFCIGLLIFHTAERAPSRVYQRLMGSRCSMKNPLRHFYIEDIQNLT